MKFTQLEKEMEKELAALSAKMSPKFKARAVEIIKELKKTFPITGLIMGMGGYVLKGGKMKGKDEHDDEIYEMEISELLDILDPRWNFRPIGLTKKHKKIILELKSILEFLTEDHNLEIFDLTEQDLKD